MRVTTFDVGQASAAIVQFNETNVGVLDCGVDPQTGRNPVVDALATLISAEPNVTICFVLLTHLDFDHISGVADLLEHRLIQRRIRRLWCGGTEFRGLVQVAKRDFRLARGATAHTVSSASAKSIAAIVRFINNSSQRDGVSHDDLVVSSVDSGYPRTLHVAELPGHVFRLFAPTQQLKDRSLQPLERLLSSAAEENLLSSYKTLERLWNGSSVVLSIEASGSRVLVTGDADKHTWTEVLKRGVGREISMRSHTVLAWHHGSRLGDKGDQPLNDRAWEAAAEPQCVVMASHGCGLSYGHPHPETVAGVHKSHGSIFCTQLKESAQPKRPPAEAFRSLGSALELGVGPTWFFNSTGTACCGDMTVELEPDGIVRRVFSVPPGHPLPGCCLRLNGEATRASHVGGPD